VSKTALFCGAIGSLASGFMHSEVAYIAAFHVIFAIWLSMVVHDREKGQEG